MFEKIAQYRLERGKQYALADLTYQVTYEQLYDYIAGRQIELRQSYKVGDCIILSVESQMAFAIDFLCFVSIGCLVIPIPNEMSQKDQIALQNEVNARIVKSDQTVIEQCIHCEQKGGIIDSSNASFGGILHLTSGTLGKMKLCIRKLERLIAEGESYIQCFNIDSKDKILSACPIVHSFAFGGAFIPALLAGASIYVMDHFVPRQVLRTIENEKISFLFMVSVIANALDITNKNNKYDLSSLRVALVGAGKISNYLFENYLERYHISLCSNYGSTETGGLVSRVNSNNFESIGKAMPGVEIKICDEEGNVLEKEQVGEIYVKSTAMFTGYYGNKDSVFHKDGFFNMGDIGKIDKEGDIYILGRSKQLVKIGGKTVNPREVEAAFLKHERVKECVVVGKTDEKNNEYLKAYVIADNLSLEEIRRYLSQCLSVNKIPKIIEFVSNIKKNAVGKIDYSML